MKTRFIDSSEKTASAVITCLKNNTGAQTDFYSEIIGSLKLYLVSSATNAASGRSASSMGCIKNWLRSTISQEPLYAAFNT